MNLQDHRTLTATGIGLHYVEAGVGSPLVLLLHGWPGTWRDWREVLRLLNGLHVVAPDLRGFGRSDKPYVAPADGYTPDHLASDLSSLLDVLGSPPTVVVGHDVGATVAQALARMDPDRVRALVLCNPPYPGIGERRHRPDVYPEFWYQQLHALPWAESLIAHSRATVRIYLRHFLDHWSGPGWSISDAELEHLVDAFATENDMRGSFAYYRARAATRAAEASQEPALLRLRQPAFVCWGRADPLMRSEWSDRLAEYFDLQSLELLEQVGHFVPLEAPDAVARNVRRAIEGLR